MNKTLLCCVILFLSVVHSGAKSVKQYQKEIKSTNAEIEKIQNTLKKKEAEKVKYGQEEKDIKKELSLIKKELEAIKQEGEKLKRKIKTAEANLKKAEKDLKLAGWEKKQWEEAINRELNLWYKGHKAIDLMFEDNILEKLRLDALFKKKDYAQQAGQRENFSRNAMISWQEAQKKLVGLKKEKEAVLVKQNEYKGKKEALLQTTVGKKIAAEEEIKDLSSSARALIDLVIKLEREKKKTESEIKAKQEFSKKKGQLPWPVEGKIISNFGRNKHPSLDTYVINNGIKIQAVRGSQIKAVSSGEIMFSGEFMAYGQMVILDNKGGFYTIYGNLASLSVKEGQKIMQGDIIGTLSDANDTYLYFEVRTGEKAEDPKLWLK